MKKIINNKCVILLLALLLNACRTSPIYNTENISISPRSSATKSEVSEAIWSAGRRLGWRMEKIKPGEMRGIYKKNTHRAIIAIHYDKSHFNIVYLDSEELKYDGSKIHVYYNEWIKKLEKKIQNEINFRLP